ncbi:MAG: DUF2155 domain-containing protein [Caulobacterales bacterium]|nr:DUF2155 domain-containing protein [Caulobacterales bacterium]
MRLRRSPLILRRAALGVSLAALAGIAGAQTPPPPDAAKILPPEEAAPAVAGGPAPTPAPAPEAKDLAPPAPAKPAAPTPPPEPLHRTRYDIAVLQALDKVTAETLMFEAPVNQPVRWKGLIFTVRACERAAPDEPIDDSIVYLTIDSQPRPQPGRPSPPAKNAFRGWMYASSPGLNPLQHATYDAWAISCRAKAPLTPVVATKPAAPKPAAAEPKLLDLPPPAPPAKTPSVVPPAKAPVPAEPKSAPDSPPTSP